MPNQEFCERSAHEITTTQELLMSVLKSQELYGLAIAKAISEATDGEHSIPVGSLYPILRRLEKKGLVKSTWGDATPEKRGGARRRYYSLTGLGSKTLSDVQQLRSAVLNWQPV